MTKNIIKRILATFAASALGVLGAGALVGVHVWQAALMAGIGGVASVLEALSRSYLNDGRLTVAEVNDAFSGPTKKKK